MTLEQKFEQEHGRKIDNTDECVEWLKSYIERLKKLHALLDGDNSVYVVGKCANCGVEYHIHSK